MKMDGKQKSGGWLTQLLREGRRGKIGRVEKIKRRERQGY